MGIDREQLGIGLLIIGIFSAVVIGSTVGFMYVTDPSHYYYIDEGVITEKRFENDGGWGSNDAYIITINNTAEYNVGQIQYNSHSVGTYVKIYYKSIMSGSYKLIEAE